MLEADHPAAVVHLQQAVDGGGLAAGQLAQPLGGPAGGGAEGHPLGLRLEDAEDGLDGGGLAGAGAAGQHQTVLGHRLTDGLPLLGRIGEALGQFQHLEVLFQPADALLFPPHQGRQPVGDGLFGLEQVGQVDVLGPVPAVGGQPPLVQAASQGVGQLVGRLVDEGRGGGHQTLPRQAGVAVAGVMAQGAQQGGLQPLGAVPLHLVILGDAVGVAEVQLQRLAAQQIGVGRDGLGRPRPEGAEHLHGPPGADLELGQVGDQFPHAEHPLELLLDAVGLLGRDALDLGQAGGLVGDDVEGRGPELFDQLAGGGRPDVGQGPAGQKGVDRVHILGHIGDALDGVELPAIGGVGLVPAPAGDALAHMQLPQRAADHREGAAPRQLKDDIAAVAVFKDDVLDRTLELFQLLFLLFHRHRRRALPSAPRGVSG